MGKARAQADVERYYKPFKELDHEQIVEVRDLIWNLAAREWANRTIADYLSDRYSAKINDVFVQRELNGTPPNFEAKRATKESVKQQTESMIVTVEHFQSKFRALHDAVTPAERLLKMADVKMQQIETIALLVNSMVYAALIDGKVKEAIELGRLADTYNTKPSEYLRLADYAKAQEPAKDMSEVDELDAKVGEDD